MPINRNYDTVAFDVRENATMLFFAHTTATGDIDDYVLLLRAEGEDFEDSMYLEINEGQLSGHDLVREARLTGNVLRLELKEPAGSLDGADEIVLTYEDTAENQASIAAGAFRVLGDTLSAGTA